MSLRVLPMTALILLASAAACSDGYSYLDALEIETEVNPNLDFASYERFEIVNPIDELYDEPPEELEGVNLGILGGIERGLEDAGLVRSEVEAQLRVTPYVTIEPTDEFQAGVFGYYWGYDYDWATPREHEVGVLVIDVVDLGDPLDADDDVLAFRGIVRNIEGDSQEAVRALVQAALDQVFDEFPTS